LCTGNASEPSNRLPGDLVFTNGFIFDFIPVELIELIVAWNNNNTRQ
jgi:hypothetical protein